MDKTRYVKGNDEALLITKRHAYEITFTMPYGMKYTSEFSFEDYGSQSNALSCAEYELACYGYSKKKGVFI